MIIPIDDITSLTTAAPLIIDFIGEQRIVLFRAPMGAGKTTLISVICKHLGVTDQTSSPTFSIVNEYESPVGSIYHFDFYRLKDEQEAYDLGYEDYFYSGHYCFVEWPEKIPSLLPTDFVSVDITILADGKRQLRIQKH